MLPHLGSGAGQATEDAFVLSSLLALALKRESISSKEEAMPRVSLALDIYDRVRRPIGLETQHRSRLQARLYTLEEGLELADPAETRRRIEENWSFRELLGRHL
jgi:salicylate hydroxylase